MNKIIEKLPGILLCIAIAWLGIFISDFLGKELLNFEKSPISPIMLAIILGIIIRVVFFPYIFNSGVQFSLKFILRLGIIFLGIRLSIEDIFKLGFIGIPLVAVCIIVALTLTSIFAKLLKINQKMGVLIAVGSSICGATAIVATAPLINAEKEEVTYAIANITIFGLLAMLFYPYLANYLFDDASQAIGLFLGTAIHETAQVAAAGLIFGQLFDNEQVLNTATLTKLIRNSFMAIVIPFLAYRYYRNTAKNQAKFKITQAFPIFIIGFIIFSVVRSLGDFTLSQQGSAFFLLAKSSWVDFIKSIKYSAEICLTVAMAAIGLNTNLTQLKKLGIKPFYIGFAAAMTVGIFSLGGIYTLIFFNLIP